MEVVLLAFVGLTLLSAAIFSFLMNKIRRRKATYAIYESRDRFVLLAAKGIVSEESKFFNYYYKRLNSMLSHSPDIGIDDAVKSFIKEKNSSNFKRAMEKAKSEAESVLKCKEMECEEAAEAARFYYEATREMILAHSSFLRLSYYAVSHVGNEVVRRVLLEKLPAKIQQALAVVKFTSEEADNLSGKRNFAH